MLSTAGSRIKIAYLSRLTIGRSEQIEERLQCIESFKGLYHFLMNFQINLPLAVTIFTQYCNRANLHNVAYAFLFNGKHGQFGHGRNLRQSAYKRRYI